MDYRFASSVAAAVAAFALPAVALAQQAEPALNPQAEQLNDEGKELYKNKDFQGAAAKFREAIGLAPDARYYFNLCATLEKAGDLNGAVEACDTVYSYAPNDELKAKTGQRAAAIRQTIRSQQGSAGGTPVGGETPGGAGAPGDPPAGGQPPGGDVGAYPGGGPPPPVAVQQSAPGEYNWAFGGEAGPIVATDIVEGVDTGAYLKLYADKGFSKELAGRVYLGFGGWSAQNDLNGTTDTLSLFEAGVSGIYNVKIANNLYVSPMAGVQLAGFSVAGLDVGTFGVNVGVPISLTFQGGKHVVYVNPASLAYYLPSSTTDQGLNLEFDGGLNYMVTFGYQMRWGKGEKLPGFVVLE